MATLICKCQPPFFQIPENPVWIHAHFLHMVCLNIDSQMKVHVKITGGAFCLPISRIPI